MGESQKFRITKCNAFSLESKCRGRVSLTFNGLPIGANAARRWNTTMARARLDIRVQNTASVSCRLIGSIFLINCNCRSLKRFAYVVANIRTTPRTQRRGMSSSCIKLSRRCKCIKPVSLFKVYSIFNRNIDFISASISSNFYQLFLIIILMKLIIKFRTFITQFDLLRRRNCVKSGIS